jgi:hypothetical protein
LVNEEVAQLGKDASNANTLSKEVPESEYEVSVLLRDQEDVARKAAAEITCVDGKDTLKIRT